MHGHGLLAAITVVLCVAAVTTIACQRLRQPVVLGYLVAGLIVGPHVPIPLVADRATVETLSELGIILLMFSLGLEFSLRKLAAVGPSAAVTAVIQSSFMLWIGFLAGRGLGWTTRESLFCGAIVAISSTTIIAKAFDEQGVRGPLRELVVGVLIVEDLIAILLMALLTAVATGSTLTAGSLLATGGRLAAFLVGLVSVGLLVVPRLVRAVIRLGRPETTLVASVGLCFAVSLLAAELGYSVALGAFLAGSLIAESGEEKEIEHLVGPVRDLFAGIFFVSVGMLIDPALVARHWLAVVALTALVLGGKVVGVSVGAFLSGSGTRTAVQAGMSLAQIGEFSFIIAGLGVSLGATRDFLYPVAVAVSALTTLTTPWLIRAAPGVASFVDRRLPRPLQTFAALYGSWVEQLRATPAGQGARGRARRLVRLLLLDGALLGGLLLGVALEGWRIAAWAVAATGLPPELARVLVLLGAAVLAAPLVYGVVGIARGLGLALALLALPGVDGGAPARLDLAAAPRRALVVTLQLAAVLLVGLPLVALLQPLVPGAAAGAILGVVLLLLGVGFWRSATNLHGHVRAGSRVIVEALLAQAGTTAATDDGDGLAAIRQLLPGLGAPVPVRVGERSAAVGRSLAELDLRGTTGASVLAIARGGEGVVAPTAAEVLRAGDVLALAGTREAVEAARAVLGREGAGAGLDAGARGPRSRQNQK